ncbi:class I SAM-dependent methyltransferase [Actinacidiphila bryophytorum]|uniref:class I SAM-dependent methyltransferase n=1 Tax=Actinacidiphila bryophytorum TaxID=1436133 RepID=UPI0019620AB9|nr:class I SAM-dependent methyltransferase [Actinacidiphila bryophytorum]MBM9437249.1 class I SAM-dependent methyltransferase [Actinacidiphila bryophytorum]MBN6541769.1 class I SAM-dependent methyltransferase [Actinacidiphila bryophytorum]
MKPNPFLASSLAPLYGDASRLASRTSALGQAKVSGRPVPVTIARLALEHAHPDLPLRTVADIGCGRGTSSRVLAEQLTPRRLTAIDASGAMLSAARVRVGAPPGTETGYVQADFHRLPLATGTYDLVVAAFCLYHSPRPGQVIAEFARVLHPQGVAVLVTKSADSYSELDALLASSGLDPEAPYRESLYAAAHSGNVAAIVASGLEVLHVEHEDHGFRFTDLAHVAAYVATNPKYHLAPGLRGDPTSIAEALRARLPEAPVTASSTITYVVARPPGVRR